MCLSADRPGEADDEIAGDHRRRGTVEGEKDLHVDTSLLWGRSCSSRPCRAIILAATAVRPPPAGRSSRSKAEALSNSSHR